MKHVERDGWSFDVNPDAQQHYYEEQDLCGCLYCVNFRKQIEEHYPELVSFLSELGVNACRMDECSSLTCDDGTIDYFCVEYLVCGKIIDSVPYEIDVGPVSIVVQTDGMLLKTNAGDAFLLQVYGIKLPDQYGLVEEEHESETIRRKKRHRIAAAFTIFLAVLIIIPSICYLSYYAYWGRRHSLLWDVKRVHVLQDTDDKNSVVLVYDYTVKNWPHDNRERYYYLGSWLTGEPGLWYFEVIGNNQTVPELFAFTSNRQGTEGSFSVCFKPATVVPGDDEGTLTVGDVIQNAIEISRFRPYSKDGTELVPVESGTLYMEDYPEVEIVYEVDSEFLNQSFETFLGR